MSAITWAKVAALGPWVIAASVAPWFPWPIMLLVGYVTFKTITETATWDE